MVPVPFLLSRLRGRSRKAAARNCARKPRLSLEPLEERQLLSSGVMPTDAASTEFVASLYRDLPSNSPPAVIRTAFGAIPDFGANPTIRSVASGAWSNPNTWSLGRVPATGDIVDISPNTTVTYDVASTAHLNTVEVQAGGNLMWRPSINTVMYVGNLLVLPNAVLTVGTAASPIAANVSATIFISNQAINTAIDPSQFGTSFIGLGTVSIQGSAKTAYVTLATEAHAGDTTLTLAQAPSGWMPGDRLVLPDTRQLLDTQTGSDFVPQWETLTIASVNGNVVTLTKPLQFDHLGARDASGALRYLPQVADLTRNIIFASEKPQGTRGYAVFTGNANVDIQYADFTDMGRTTIKALDNTTFNSSGGVAHIGTNQDDRYALDFASLAGPTTPQADGYQFTSIGNVVSDNQTTVLYKWGMTIDTSNNGLLDSNIVYNMAGAGFAVENGTESGNVIQNNFAMRISGTRGNETTDNQTTGYGRTGTGFWLHSVNNYVRNNISTDNAFYGFVINLINVTGTSILEFSGNEAYGAMPNGLTIWNLGATGTSMINIGTSVVKNFTVWHVYEYGYYGYPTSNLVLDGFVDIGDPAALTNRYEHVLGIWFSDYYTRNTIITNADLENLQTGIIAPTKAGDTRETGTLLMPFTVENSYLRNYTDIVIGTLTANTGGGSLLAPRQTILRNDMFLHVNMPDRSDAPQLFIDMRFEDTPRNHNEYGTPNVIQTDVVNVFAFNRVASDNFQVFYLQQNPNFVLPLTVTRTTNAEWLVGAPVPGLTNQLAWKLFHIAIAGEISPTTNTRAGILGYVL